MEALIVGIAALAVLVLIDTGYWIAIGLARWSPILAVGILAGWLAHRLGAESLEALAIGFLASVIARHFMQPRFMHDDTGFD